MRIVIAGALGAAGEILPFIAVGAELRRRGHQVEFLGNPYFSRAASEAGLSFIPTGSEAEQEALMTDPGLFGQPRKTGLQIFNDHYFPRLEEHYRAIDDLIASGKSPILLTNEVAAVTAGERRGLTRVKLVLAPARLASRYDPPHAERIASPWKRALNVGAGLALQSSLRRLRLRFAGSLPPGPPFPHDHPLVLLRQRLGLPRGAQSTYRPRLSPCLWPDWFAGPQPDWPPDAMTVGFTRGSSTSAPESHPALAGLPSSLVVATTGSLARSQHTFFRRVVKVCSQLGRPAVLVSPHRDHIPPDLPANIVHMTQAPFGALFRLASLVIHHGGIGTTAEALASGVRQLVTPLRGEQFDVGSRVERLGVGRMVAIEDVPSSVLTRLLARLLESSRVERQCRRWQARLVGQDGASRAADLIETLQ